MATVSVIMPCFNHGRFVEESVQGVLGQSHRDLELLIVDDCSSDGSWEAVCDLAQQDERIKPIRNDSNRGVSFTRNVGLAAAKGEFIAFCDADDVWAEEKLQIQIAFLMSAPAFDVAYADSILVDTGGVALGGLFSSRFPPPARASGDIFHELLKGNFINTQTVVMRRTCLGVGVFDQNLRVVEDWAYWIRIARRHQFGYIRQPLGKYRVHGSATCVANPRSYFVSRYKVHRRVLESYPELPAFTKARLAFNMGADLCHLDKRREGRRLLWKSLAYASADARAVPIACRALRRLVLPNAGITGSRLRRAAAWLRGEVDWLRVARTEGNRDR
jgi:glycosyltransferase involved in cell wall biosynthesis